MNWILIRIAILTISCALSSLVDLAVDHFVFKRQAA